MNISDFKEIPIVSIAIQAEAIKDLYYGLFEFEAYIPKEILSPIYESVKDFSYNTEAPVGWHKGSFDADDIDDRNRDIVSDAIQKHLKPHLKLPFMMYDEKNNFCYYVNGLLDANFSYPALVKYFDDIADKICEQLENNIMEDHLCPEGEE